MFLATVGRREKALVWACECTNKLYWLTDAGPECFHCGKLNTEWKPND